ncbi:hypothetical protein BAE44_0018845 [Dichanthelium oligosanthes]|uniref:At1g61320/AtMIF1 LRR domain-containing protein n=1 Tax=Dichanthelium oligosanthes TaxID=888268 RepID=A0A1E5V4P5_9POAL|nr:hypothetical protein BAE44_0018845 [Dichanthelium oligosanthes]
MLPVLLACDLVPFLRSWRCRPVLALNRHIIGSNTNAPQENFSCIIDNILRTHSGIGIKIFRLELYGIFDACHYLDRWLQIAVTPEIEKLTLKLCHRDNMEYNVTCTLLSHGVRNSIQCLQLSLCAFHPTAELGLLRKLTSLPAFSLLLEGFLLLKAAVIESKARNLSSFILVAGGRVKVSLGETLQMKNLHMCRSNLVCYARAELPSRMPNLETLSSGSRLERVDTSMLPTKFLFLKHLSISLKFTFCPSYDYFSLVSFLDASPSLKTWLLDESMDQESIFGGSSQLRQMPEQRHGRLKSFKIKGFNSAKNLVELTCYILKNAKSLDCLTIRWTSLMAILSVILKCPAAGALT